MIVKLGDIEYELTYKNVKNINLRIRPDGTVSVSANRWTSRKTIDAFVLSKVDFIQNALNKYASDAMREKKAFYTEEEVKGIISDLCTKAYPHFAKRGVAYPKIKFRSMVSRWGSCHSSKGIVTFSTKLMYAPIECIEYVVYHEFTHFLQANHSPLFYEELSKAFPNWSACRKKLRSINIR